MKRFVDWAVWGAHVSVSVLGLARVFYPEDLDQSQESWAVSALINSGTNPWTLDQVNHPPFTIPGYGPLYHLVHAAGVRLFGLQFWFPRLLILAWLLVMSLLIRKMVAALCGDQFPAKCAQLIFILSTPALGWAGAGRADAWGLGLILAGFTLLTMSRSTRALVAAAVLCGLTPLAKQSWLLAPALGTLYVIERDGWKVGKRALIFAAIAFAVPGSVIGGLYIATHGDFWTIAYRYHAMPTRSFAKFVSALWKVASDPTFIVIVACLAWAWKARRSAAVDEREAAPFPRTLLVWLALAVAMSAMTGSRLAAGGEVNYWLEPAAGAALLVGVAMARVSLVPGSSYERGLLGILAVWVLISSVSFVRHARGAYFHFQALAYTEEVSRDLERLTPPSEPVFNYFSGIPVRANRLQYFNNPLFYTLSTPENRDLLLSWIDEGRFSAMLLQRGDLFKVPDLYVRVETRHAFPSKIFACDLFVRRDLMTASTK